MSDEIVKPQGLRAKLCTIMGEIGYIEKRGRNTAQNYDYVMAADVAAAAAKLCSKYGVAFWPSQEQLEWETRQTSKDRAMFVCRAKITFTFADAESDERIEIPVTGEGQDTGDKAVYKARTGALKYALLQTFLIASGDDPEAETDEHDIKAPANAPKVEEEKKGLPPCPKCGNATSMIVGRPEYGGGFVCYKKKGGCGATYADNDPRFNSPGRLAANGQPVLDDGNVQIPLNRQTISAEQVTQLESWCGEFNVQPSALIRQYQTRDKGVQRLADLTQEMFDHAETVFNAKRAKGDHIR